MGDIVLRAFFSPLWKDRAPSRGFGPLAWVDFAFKTAILEVVELLLLVVCLALMVL